MRNIFFITYLVFLSLVSCTKNNNNNNTSDPEVSKDLTIFIVNDVHAQIDNFSKVKYIIDKEREETNVIVTSGGDMFSGNPIVDNYPQKGYPMIDLMNKVGFDVSAIGNHEFDYGEENLKNMIEQSQFEWICSNVDMSNSVIPQPADYTTINVGDLKVTFMGLIETDGKEDDIIPSTHPWRVQNITFERPEDVVSRYSNIKVQEDSDLYIALTHIGLNKSGGRLGDYQLAEQFPYFDLIIGGHSHSKANEVVNNIPIFQAGGNLTKLGKIQLTIKDKKIESIEYELIDLSNQTEHDKELKDLIDDYNDSPYFYESIGFSNINHSKTEVGCFVTDVSRLELDIDLTFQNTGGVRSTLGYGEIIRKDIFEILPFNNPMIIYKMTVSEIKNFLISSGSGFYYSGVTFETVDRDIEVRDLEGNIIPNETVLTVGLNDYIAAVHDSYFPDNGIVKTQTDAETVISYLENTNTLVDYSGCNGYYKY